MVGEWRWTGGGDDGWEWVGADPTDEDAGEMTMADRVSTGEPEGEIWVWRIVNEPGVDMVRVRVDRATGKIVDGKA